MPGCSGRGVDSEVSCSGLIGKQLPLRPGILSFATDIEVHCSGPVGPEV